MRATPLRDAEDQWAGDAILKLLLKQERFQWAASDALS
jgi:hypothetical protein